MEKIKQVVKVKLNKVVKAMLVNINDLLVFTGVTMFICTMFSIDITLGWVVLSIVLILYGLLLSKIKWNIMKRK